MKKTIINLNDIMNDLNFLLQIGTDKNGSPVYVGDIVMEEKEELFSADQMNIFREEKSVGSMSSEKKMYKWKVYRKVLFDGSNFVLKRVKEENAPYLSVASERIDELNQFVKVDT